MVSDHTEDLPPSAASPRSSSPTISTIGTTEFGQDEDDTQVLAEHPSASYFGDLVNIQIENSLFRVPRNLLAHQSTYFESTLSFASQTTVLGLHVTEGDVSAKAFENLLLLLSPRTFGVETITTLDQWTDILHLATKWNFSVVRTAAIHAILPLSSSVDRVVLGRAYDVECWLMDALTEIIVREEDLTEEEDARLSRGDLRAIAKGQRQLARMTETPSNDEVKRMVIDLFPELFTLDRTNMTFSAYQDFAEPPEHDIHETIQNSKVSSEQKDDDEYERNVRRWIGADVTSLNDESNSTRACLIKSAAGCETRQVMILEILLEQDFRRYNSDEIFRWCQLMDSPVPVMFDILKSEWKGCPFEDLARTACLRVVKNWDVLLTHTLRPYPERMNSVALEIEDVSVSTRYIRNLIDKSVLPHSVYTVFWDRMLSLLRLGFGPNHTRDWVPEMISWIMGVTCVYVFTNAACLEIDAFYQAIDELRAQPAIDNRRKSALYYLTRVIEDRKYPSDFCRSDHPLLKPKQVQAPAILQKKSWWNELSDWWYKSVLPRVRLAICCYLFLAFVGWLVGWFLQLSGFL